MTTTLMGRTYADIRRWWPSEEDGKPKSVYAVYQTIVGTPLEVNRHTLTRARDGLLEKGDFTNLKTLARLCSHWSGQTITVDQILVDK